MLTVLGRRTSSNVQLVMWTLAELGLDAERRDYGHRHGGVDTREYRALNPNGLVPTLLDGDLVLWESGAIMRYLAARYGDGGDFWPADPVRRAPVDQWAEWGKVTLGAAFTMPIFWALVRTPAAERDEGALERSLARFDTLLAILEDQLAGKPHLVGESLTVADIAVGHVLYRYFTMDIPRADRPVLAAYYDRLASRPAYREHVMVSYDELRAEGA